MLKKTIAVLALAFTTQTFAMSSHDMSSFVSDTIITAKIKGLLTRDKIVDRKHSQTSIDVETTNGIVKLSGVTENEEQYKKAMDIASSVSGVHRIETNVTIKESED
jgi:hyperosmotically inducible protein